MAASQAWARTRGRALRKLEEEHSYIVVSSGILELGVCLGVRKRKQKTEIRVARSALDVVIRRGLKPPLKHGPMIFIKRSA